MGHDQHGPPLRTSAPGPAPAGWRASWALENDDLRRRAAAHGSRRPIRARWPDQPRCLRGLRREGSRPGAEPRRRRRHGQPIEPQGSKRASADRKGRRRPALPAALQSGLQSNRERLCQTEGAPPEGCRADHRGPLEGDRPARRHLHPIRVRQLLRRRGVRADVIGFGSNRMQFLQQSKIDLIIGGMYDTAERRKIIGIIEPAYWTSGPTLLAKKGAIKDWKDIAGKPVCAKQGVAYNKLVETQYKSPLTAFAGNTEGKEALR